MEGVVVEVRVRASCKRFAIKDNGIRDRCERGIDDRKGKLHSFFSPENNAGGDTHDRKHKHGVLSGLPITAWRADSSSR